MPVHLWQVCGSPRKDTRWRIHWLVVARARFSWHPRHLHKRRGSTELLSTAGVLRKVPKMLSLGTRTPRSGLLSEERRRNCSKMTAHSDLLFHRSMATVDTHSAVMPMCLRMLTNGIGRNSWNKCLEAWLKNLSVVTCFGLVCTTYVLTMTFHSICTFTLPIGSRMTFPFTLKETCY